MSAAMNSRQSALRRAPSRSTLSTETKRLPVPAPSATPSATPGAGAANQPDDQQQQQRADRGVDYRRDDADAKMDAELGHEPLADAGAYDSDDEISDNSKPGASNDLARQPSRNEADQQYDKQTLARHACTPMLELYGPRNVNFVDNGALGTRTKCGSFNS
jgi:hypothetical protein